MLWRAEKRTTTDLYLMFTVLKINGWVKGEAGYHMCFRCECQGHLKSVAKVTVIASKM